MARITMLQVKGFKSIHEISLNLKRLNVFIGANGSGKSNLLSLFRMLNFITSGHLQQYVGQSGGAEKLLYYGSKRTPQIQGEILFETSSGENTYQFVLSKAAGDTLIFTEEQVKFTRTGLHDSRSLVSLGVGHKETMMTSADLPNSVVRISKTIRNIMNLFRFYQFHDTSENANIKQNSYVNDNQYLRSDAGNLAAYLYYLKVKQEPHYKKIISTIQQVAPYFEEFVLKPLNLKTDQLNLDWIEKGSDIVFDVNQLSDGTLRFIALATLLLQPDLPHLIIIDEPELGLHPYAISVVASLMKGASTKCQIIVSTQSASLVNQFEPEDIIVVDRKEKQSSFHRLESGKLENWLDEYTIGELWEKNVIGGRPS